MYYTSKESQGKKYITFLVRNANLGAIASGITFVNFSASGEYIMSYLVTDPGDDEATAYIYFEFLIYLLFGAILGGLISIPVVNHIGRRKAMIIADVLTIIGCLAVIRSNLISLLLGRIICGAALGLNMMVIPVYVREISPPELSGRLGSYFRICFTIGLLIPFVCTLGFLFDSPPRFLCELVYRMPCFFAVARLLNLLKRVEFDTPQFYMDRNQDAKAIAALEKILGGDRIEHIYHREKKFEIKGIRGLFGPKYRKQVLLVLLLIFASEFMGSNSLILNTSIIIAQGSTSPDGSQDQDPFQDSQIQNLLNIAMGLARLISSILGSILLEKAGRKRLFLGGMLFSMFLIFWIVRFINYKTIQICVIMLYSLCQSLTVSLVLPIYASELLPPSGVSLQVVFQMVCLLLSTRLYENQATVLFLYFALVGLVTILPIYKLAKETKGKTLNEVCFMFQPEYAKRLLDQSMDESVSELDGLNLL